MAEAVETVDQLLAQGRAAAAADPRHPTATAACRAGEAELEQGRFRAALRDKSEALALAERTRDPLLAAECARSIAVVYSFAGQHARAIEWADRAETALDQAGASADPARAAGVRAPLLKVRADAALDRGDLAQGRALLAQAQAASPDYFRPYALTSLAQVDLALGQSAAADAELDQALASPGVSDGLYAIIVRKKGEIALARSDFVGARALFAFGARLSAAMGDSYADAWAERGLARAEVAAGRPDAAIAAYARAAAAAERSRAVFHADEFRSGAFGTLQTVFDEAVSTLAAQGRWEEAFDLSERGRARGFRDLLRGEVEAGPDRPATARQTEAILPEGVVLVSYHALPDRLLIWTVRHAGLAGTAVPLPVAQLDATVREFTRLAADPGREQALRPSAQSLYASLVAPAQLRPGERVVFEPFGTLHNLAFAALRNGERFLVEDHASSVVLVAGSLRPEAPEAPAGRDTLVFADPDGSLPFADREADAIAANLPGTTVVRGAQATSDRFLAAAPRARIVHVAAHAAFDPVEPLSSRIRLAGRDIEAREVYGLRLGHVDMLVLSACETSIGAPSPGDEIIGFNRSFLSAGVRDLVSALWSVNDQATAALMAFFYQSLAKGQPAPEALRAAQLTLLHNGPTASPTYWAAFALTRSTGGGGSP